MSCPRTQPSWEFLLTASLNTLQPYKLSRVGHAANLRKEISSLLDQWLDENANALVARWRFADAQDGKVCSDEHWTCSRDWFSRRPPRHSASLRPQPIAFQDCLPALRLDAGEVLSRNHCNFYRNQMERAGLASTRFFAQPV